MRVSRGDVVLVRFPNSDLRTYKIRPALVVQADDLQTGIHQTVVSLITSKVARGAHPSRAMVSLKTQEGQRTGLKTDSVILTDNLVTVQYSLVDRAIGNWGNMASVEQALRHTLGL